MAALLNETNTNEVANDELHATVRDLLAQLADLSARVAAIEKLAMATAKEPLPVSKASEPVVASQPSRKAAPKIAEGITEEEVLAISAAIAAWLGVQAHIRQIRLIRSPAWAQQGRVTIQASHRLH